MLINIMFLAYSISQAEDQILLYCIHYIILYIPGKSAWILGSTGITTLWTIRKACMIAVTQTQEDYRVTDS